jgi:hypothetical protein
MTDHLYARNSATNEWCSAATCNRVGSYVCWCPDKHAVFVRKPRGKEGVRVITAHFAHFRASDDHSMSVCRKGGESAEHVNAKMALKTMAGQFSFVMSRCPECEEEIVEDCGNGTVVLELRSDDKKWRYDAVYTDANGRATALEVYHSHATTEEKIKSTRSKGMRIAEFSASDVLELAEDCRGGRLENLVMETELCSLQCRNRVAERERMKYERQNEAERIREEERKRTVWLEQERKRVERQEQEARRKAETQRREDELKQKVLDREAADDKWKKAIEKHRQTCAIKNANKKKSKIATTSKATPHQADHCQPTGQPHRKRERRTYNLGSFGFYPPNSRPFIDFCHHGVSRRRFCEHCAQSDAEYEQLVASEEQDTGV